MSSAVLSVQLLPCTRTIISNFTMWDASGTHLTEIWTEIIEQCMKLPQRNVILSVKPEVMRLPEYSGTTSVTVVIAMGSMAKLLKVFVIGHAREMKT